MLYAIAQVVWINYRDGVPTADQRITYDVAVSMVDGNVREEVQGGTAYFEGMSTVEYFEVYNQQFGTAFIWSMLFRITGSTSIAVIEYSNVVTNTITVAAIYLICKELSRKYDVNKYLGVFIIMTFITLPLLSIFIYGDLSSLAFALLSVYFIIKYTNEKKVKYVIFSLLCMMLAYMLRMNILIFILAVQVYLFIDLISEKRNIKEVLLKILVMIGFFAIMIPQVLVKNYYCNKCEIDSNRPFPKTGYFFMGMTESVNPGWYNIRRAQTAYYRDLNEANEIYIGAIKEELKDYGKDPGRFLDFYKRKLASMWTENTYAGVFYNYSNSFQNLEHVNLEIDKQLVSVEDIICMYQKGLIFIIFGVSLIVIIQNRRNMSNDLILLLTIFIGGFLFHVLWEAKSRYIIPYIIVLIPIATIKLNDMKRR